MGFSKRGNASTISSVGDGTEKVPQRNLGVQKLTWSGLEGILKTKLPFLRLVKVLYLRGENCSPVFTSKEPQFF